MLNYMIRLRSMSRRKFSMVTMILLAIDGIIFGQGLRVFGKSYSLINTLDTSQYTNSKLVHSTDYVTNGNGWIMYNESKSPFFLYSYHDRYCNHFCKFYPNGRIWIYIRFSSSGKSQTEYYFDTLGSLSYVVYSCRGARQCELKVENDVITEVKKHDGRSGTVQNKTSIPLPNKLQRRVDHLKTRITRIKLD